jgi:hypothetical protein
MKGGHILQPSGSRTARTVILGCALLLLALPTAVQADQADRSETARDSSDGRLAPTARHHDGLENHLPPVQQNLDLVGELEVSGQFGDVVPGQIADHAVHKGFAYLNSWDEPSCTRGGTYIADINDPANPQEIGFIPAQPGYYHGEGAHVVSIDTPAFTGDLLAVNDEACSNDDTRPEDVPTTAGGFDLYDVSDPRNPVTLIQNAGDQTPDGSLEEDPDPERLSNSYHSVFVWQDGPRAFLVASDNVEFADVDIWDITDPRNPVFVNDLDLFTLPEIDQIVGESANGNLIFNHDMVVKRIGGVMTMMVAYWDAGYVQLNVDNPAAPTYITDTNFDEPDPLLGFDPPEGNGHQGEFSHDNQFLLAADEDFAPDRIDTVEITTGPNAGDFPGNSVGGSATLDILPDGVLNGPTVYGGYGCDASAPIPDRDTAGLPPLEPFEEAIVVLQRGPGADPDTGDPDDPEGTEEACFPGEKAENGIDAGYDAVLLVNHHRGELAGGVFCGSGDFPATPPIVAPCTTHEAYHLIFGTPPTTEIPYDPADEPDIGDLGEKVRVEASFDGWGYAHLYDAVTSEELDAFAIPEAIDRRFASGFGDLSIHEFATDPTENLAYSSYYSGGMRVLRFGRDIGLQQTGAFIDDEGSNFWGVEQFTTPGGERLIAGSDRDFGLQIFRYTGPGAAAPPSCSSTAVETAPGTPVTVPLTCSDANGNPLTRRIVTPPANGALGPIEGDSVAYTPNPGFRGLDEFRFAANDGAADSASALATVDVADKQAPETEITKRPKKRTDKRRAKFRFRSNEPDSSFECKLDGKDFKPCTSPYRKGVDVGKHRFRVRAIDASGNVDQTPAKRKWRRVTD